MSNKFVKKSKFLSLVLRHKPEAIGISLDNNGYAFVKDILKGLDISQYELDYIVAHDNKKRYSYNQDNTKIRANN